MSSQELKKILSEIEVSQNELAYLIGITPRAVSLWMTEGREVPGPAMAYARLLRNIPLGLRQAELSKLKQRRNEMRDGMYLISFENENGKAAGHGMLTLDSGNVCGADVGGARYDGTYSYNENTGLAEIICKVTFSPNAMSIFGIINPYEWSIDVTATINPKVDEGRTQVKTSLGKGARAVYKFLRALPLAA